MRSLLVDLKKEKRKAIDLFVVCNEIIFIRIHLIILIRFQFERQCYIIHIVGHTDYDKMFLLNLIKNTTSCLLNYYFHI